jgi:hypothetical protein
VFSEAADLSLNIDPDVACRRGARIALLPGHWNLFGTWGKQVDPQLGTTVAIPLGGLAEIGLAGLLSRPHGPQPHETDGSWYAERAVFPGGLLGHLAGSLAWERGALGLLLVLAGSGGRLAPPGALGYLKVSRSGAKGGLDLLLGWCGAGYYTPEGEEGAREWVAAAGARRELGSLLICADWRREIEHPPLLPAAFIESREELSGGVRFASRSSCVVDWSVNTEAGLEREWSREGEKEVRLSIEAGSSVEWGPWRFLIGMTEYWSGVSHELGELGFEFVRAAPWGKAGLESGYRFGRRIAFPLAVYLETAGEGRRLTIELAAEDALAPLQNSPERTTLRLGWEAASRE